MESTSNGGGALGVYISRDSPKDTEVGRTRNVTIT
jgi:hypothetical protein